MISRRLKDLDIELPALAPRGTYSLGRLDGSTLYVSGQGPFRQGQKALVGVVGADVTTEAAKRGARDTAVQLLAAAAVATGNIDALRSVLSLTVYVRGSADFVDHSVVADGCTELFAEVFGTERLPTRAAVGVATLPFDLALEATAVFELDPGAARG